MTGPVLILSVSLFCVPLSAAEDRLQPRLIRSAARQCSVMLSAALSGRHENYSNFQRSRGGRQWHTEE